MVTVVTVTGSEDRKISRDRAVYVLGICGDIFFSTGPLRVRGDFEFLR